MLRQSCQVLHRQLKPACSPGSRNLVHQFDGVTPCLIPRRILSIAIQANSSKPGTYWYANSMGVGKTTIRSYSSDIPREGVPFSRYPVPDATSLDKDIQEEMATVEEKSGFLPNVLQALSHRPEEFRAFFNYYDVLMNKETGSLSKAEKELIVVVTSAANKCLYCVISHSALHRIYSKNPYLADQVATNSEHANLSERERAIVEFALKICHMTPLCDEDYTKLEAHGLGCEDAWDIGAIAAFFALSNRMAHLTAMRPNEEFYLMGRMPRVKKE